VGIRWEQSVPYSKSVLGKKNPRQIRSMSSSNPAVPREGKDKKTVDKVLYRMKAVFKKGGSSRRSRSNVVPAEAPVSR